MRDLNLRVLRHLARGWPSHSISVEIDTIAFRKLSSPRFRSLQAPPSSKKSTAKAKAKSKKPLDIIMAAQAALQRKQAEAGNLEGHHDEWNTELAEEVDEEDKHGSRLPAVLTRIEIRDLLRISRKHPRNHLIIRLFYATGVRRSELEAIKLADLYLAEQTSCTAARSMIPSSTSAISR